MRGWGSSLGSRLEAKRDSFYTESPKELPGGQMGDREKVDVDVDVDGEKRRGAYRA